MQYTHGRSAVNVQLHRRLMHNKSQPTKLPNSINIPSARCLLPRTARATQLSAFFKSAAPSASPPEASLTIAPAPTTVKLADGTTVTLVDPAPRPVTPAASQTAITLPGLLGVLALSSTTLLAAAATCFMLYVRPVLQAMTVTLSEMEQAAKDMQEAADHVEATSQMLQSQLPDTLTAVQAAAEEAAELAGNINSATKLLAPSRLLRKPPDSSSSSNGTEDPTSSSSNKQGSEAAAEGTNTLLEGFRELGLSLSSNGNSSVSSILPQLQSLTAMPNGLADLLNHFDEVDSSSTSRTGGISSSSSPRTVWDAVALTLTSAKVSAKTLARLRADLKAAANVLGVLLDPTAAAPAAGTSGDTSKQQLIDPSAIDPAAAAVAAGVPAESAMSSVDGRIRIAAGVKRPGSAPVLKSLSEEDIEAALEVTSNSHNDKDTDSSSSSSSSNADKDADAAPVASSSSTDAGSAKHMAVAAAAADAADLAAAEVAEAEPAEAISRSRSSSPTGRRRRRSKRIEEDEWGLPTVVEAADSNTSSSDTTTTTSSSSSGSSDVVQQDPGSPPLPAVAASDAAQQQNASSSPAAAVARKLYPGTGVYSRGWIDDSSDDEIDYAGYRIQRQTHSHDSHQEVTSRSPSGAVATSSSSSSSSVFAGYEMCQDSLLGCDARPDDGISWDQLNQDPRLMQRVFCDNQEGIFQSGMSTRKQQQQQPGVTPEPRRQL